MHVSALVVAFLGCIYSIKLMGGDNMHHRRGGKACQAKVKRCETAALFVASKTPLVGEKAGFRMIP